MVGGLHSLFQIFSCTFWQHTLPTYVDTSSLDSPHTCTCTSLGLTSLHHHSSRLYMRSLLIPHCKGYRQECMDARMLVWAWVSLSHTILCQSVLWICIMYALAHIVRYAVFKQNTKIYIPYTHACTYMEHVALDSLWHKEWVQAS